MKNKKIMYSVVSILCFVLVNMTNAQNKISNNELTQKKTKEVKMITPNTAFPVFIVNNIEKAKTFYEKYFDFNVVFENEWYLHLVSNSGIQVAFMLPDQPTQPNIYHTKFSGSGVIFSLEVNDADSVYSFAKKQALDIVLDLRSEEWGQRHFSLKDPNGIYIDIIQAIQPTDEYKQDYEDK